MFVAIVSVVSDFVVVVVVVGGGGSVFVAVFAF